MIISPFNQLTTSWSPQPTISYQQSIHMFVGHFFACITIMSPLYPHWMSNLPQCLYYICICLQLFAYFFLTHYAICFPHIRVVYIRTYITIISICSHYTILTTSSLVKPGVGKSPDLGILNITLKYMLDMISRTVGWLASGTLANPIQPLPHHDSCWFQKNRKQTNFQRNPCKP